MNKQKYSFGNQHEFGYENPSKTCMLINTLEIHYRLNKINKK